MKIEYEQCDLCKEKIEKGGYKLKIDRKSENSEFKCNARAYEDGIDICEKCMTEIMLSPPIERNNKKIHPFYYMVPKNPMCF